MEKETDQEDILRPLTNKELIVLQDIYKNHFGPGRYHYYYILNLIKWKLESEEKVKFINKSIEWKFYTHRKSHLIEHGTFVCIMQDCLTKISFYSLDPSLKELSECLQYSKLIDWKAGPLLLGVEISLVPILEEIIFNKNADLERNRLCYFYLLKCDHAKCLKNEVSLPDGYELKELKVENAEEIHSVWPNKKEGSIKFIQEMIVKNGGIGVFKDKGCKLVAWILKNEFSGIGVLQALESERRKGFGKYIVIEMCRRIANNDKIDISAFVVCDNVKSQNLLMNVGFKKIEDVMWMQCKNLYG